MAADRRMNIRPPRFLIIQPSEYFRQGNLGGLSTVRYDSGSEDEYKTSEVSHNTAV